MGTKADFYKIMSDLTKQGVSIVMVSSDMPELLSMSDRVLVLAGARSLPSCTETGERPRETAVMAAAIGE